MQVHIWDGGWGSCCERVCVPTVNSVCWGPYDFGLILACGSSDGAISLLTLTGDQQWDVKKISNAHTVSRAPGRVRLVGQCLTRRFPADRL